MATSGSNDRSSDDQDQFTLVNQAYFDMGWSRFLPLGAVNIVGALYTFTAPTREEIGGFVGAGDVRAGLDEPAWEEPKSWTDQELRELFEEDPPLDGRLRTVEEANAEDGEHHARRVAEIDAYAAALGVSAPRTTAGTLDFMLACGFLVEISDGGTVRYRVNPQVKFPYEVLPVADDVRQREDRLRWRELHESVTYRIIDLFQPHGPHPLDVKRTSLQRLARELDLDVETTRAGLAVLLEEPDFAATHDPERLLEHQIVEIRVDWDIFARTRISITSRPQSDD